MASFLTVRKLSLMVSLFMIGGCDTKRVASEASGDSSDAASADPTPTPTPTPTASGPSLSCTPTVIDGGQKGNVAAVARGVYSDTKMIPGSSSPATAYVDPSALSIKLSYWNGSRFVTEALAGDGTGAFVRLVFLSNGTPIVFWTLGGNLKAAIRTAPLSSSGSWVAGIIDTGTAPRAVEAAVNPLNQVTVTFLTDSAVGGRAKFLYCDAPCTSPAGFQTMNSNPYIENTNLVSTETSTGAGWCKASNSVYYPVAAYAVTGATKYAICLNTLTNCLNGSNWTTSQVVATGNLSTKLYLDPTVTGDVPRVASLGASGIVIYKMGTTTCTSAFGAWTTGSTLGTATSGTQWMSFLKDSAGKFHVAANESTTSVRYYNSSSTDPTGSWNAVGTVDTTTLAAAHAGGADIDTGTLGLYMSYGINVAPFDLKLGRVNDYTQTSSVATFTRFTPDLSGDLQLLTAGTQLKQISVATTSLGRPGVAYVDFSVGAVTNAKLKYAYRPGDSSAVLWESFLIPNTINPQFPSLSFDSANRPWIAYFDASQIRFFLTTNSATDGSGSWSTYEFPSIPGGAPVALPAANNTAMTMYRHSGITDPVMVVIDTNAGTKGVKAAVFDTATRSFKTPVAIDGLTGGAAGAAHLSADSDSSSIVVAYQELNSGRAKYSYSAAGVTWSSPLSVSGVSQGPGAFIKINPVTGKPSVSYYDQTNNAVYLSQCSVAAASCATGGWTPTQIEGAAGVSGLTAATGQLLSTSIAYSSTGKSYVFYPRGQGNDGNLIVTHNANGSFTSQVAAAGANANLPGAPSLNFAVAGWGVNMVNNASGSFSGAYVGPGNWLYGLSCGD